MTVTSVARLIAHRGASREAPENTQAAFDLAWRQGGDGIECDFRLTRDGRVVCIHDATTGRTSGSDISVAEASLDELRRLDIGLWKGEQWRGERIVVLEELLEQLPEGKSLFIELKCGPEIVEPLVTILQNCSRTARICILAFDADLLERVKLLQPEIRACLNVGYRWSPRSCCWRPSREEILATLDRIGADGLSSQDHALLDGNFVADLRSSGREIHVWTVDSVRRAGYYLGLGVDSIMTNRPGWMRGRLNL